MFKLLATDLDGTLLDDMSELPGPNAEYIKKALDMGVYVVICSGRSINPLEHYCRLIGSYGQGRYAIGLNGAIVFETESRKILHDIRLSRELALEIANVMKGFKVATVMYVVDRLKTTSDVEAVESYAKLSMTTIDYQKDYSELDSDVSKILAMGDTDELLRLEQHLSKRADGSFNMFMTSPTLLEFTSLEADKGTGIKFLSEYLGIGLDKVIACGDYYNDIQMLKTAGFGVAVANAEQEVKAVADYITMADNNQCAVKEIIEKFILN